MSYTAKDINKYVCTGDFVRDPMSGDLREIACFQVHSEESVTVCMTDGGVMGLNEIEDDMIFLESEVY